MIYIPGAEILGIKAIDARCVCAESTNSACSVGPQRHFAAGSTEIDAHLSGTDSSVARVNTPATAFSVLTANVPLCKTTTFSAENRHFIPTRLLDIGKLRELLLR